MSKYHCDAKVIYYNGQEDHPVVVANEEERMAVTPENSNLVSLVLTMLGWAILHLIGFGKRKPAPQKGKKPNFCGFLAHHSFDQQPDTGSLGCYKSK